MMIVLALLLLAVAALLTVSAVVGSDSVAVEVLNLDFNTTTLGVFLAGLGTGLIVLVGVALLVVGMRQTRARRREIEYLRQKVAEQNTAAGQSSSDEATDGPADQDESDPNPPSRRSADLP